MGADQIWYSLDGGPVPLEGSGNSMISMEEDPSLYRSPGGISHSSGLVKCCKSSSIKALCLITRHWEGDEVRWPQPSHTPWQRDWSPFSLLCFCFSPVCFLSVHYKQFQGKVLLQQLACLVWRGGWLLNPTALVCNAAEYIIWKPKEPQAYLLCQAWERNSRDSQIEQSVFKKRWGEKMLLCMLLLHLCMLFVLIPIK